MYSIRSCCDTKLCPNNSQQSKFRGYFHGKPNSFSRWFQMFWIFAFGEMIQFDETYFFKNGLVQPPTRKTTNSKNHQLENQLVFLEPKQFLAIFVATPTSVSSPNQIDQTCMCLYLNSLFGITYAPCMENLPTFTIHVSFAKQFYSSRCSGFKEF